MRIKRRGTTWFPKDADEIYQYLIEFDYPDSSVPFEIQSWVQSNFSGRYRFNTRFTWHTLSIYVELEEDVMLTKLRWADHIDYKTDSDLIDSDW